MLVHTESGFTLLEMAITLSLIAILAAIAAPFMGNAAQAYNHTSRNLQTVDKLRYASERLTRELREIRRDTAGNLDISTPVNAPGNNITFTKTDGDKVTVTSTSTLLNMAYATLNKNTGYILTDELKSIRFNYYLADGVSSAHSKTDVAYIEFELILNNGNDYPQRTRVALRNRL